MSARVTGGGSTITQQLARNMFEVGIGFEQRLVGVPFQRSGPVRKLREARVAKQIEEVYSKDEILRRTSTRSTTVMAGAASRPRHSTISANPPSS
jgi:membrane peptidoglycan carboxypeptidase